MQNPSIKSVRRIPFIFLVLILAYLFISGLECITSVGETKILDVDITTNDFKTYKSVKLGENSFQTGTEGRLYWKVKNVNEAFLIALANRNAVGNFYDLLYLLILDVILFIMFFKVKENNVFSNRVLLGLQLIGYSLLIYCFINFFSYEMACTSIQQLTDNKFTAQFRHDNIPKYLILCYLILFTIPFVKKGISLQQEQELTI